MLKTANDRWHARRRRSIGASDASVIAGNNPWKSAYSLAQEKMGKLAPPDLSKSLHVQAGIRLEPAIRAWTKAALFPGKTSAGYVTNPGRYKTQIHPERPYMSATLDGVLCSCGAPSKELRDLFRTLVGEKQEVLLGTLYRTPGVLELKTSWYAEAWCDGPPPYYRSQVQHQLAVTGWGWGVIAAMISSRSGPLFRMYPLLRDEDEIRGIYLEQEAFWEGVQKGEAPPIDASVSTQSTLSNLHPQEIDPPLDLTEQGDRVGVGERAAGWDKQLQEAKDREKEATQIRRYYENKLKSLIADHSGVILPGGTHYTWRTQTRGDKSFRVLRRLPKERTVQ